MDLDAVFEVTDFEPVARNKMDPGAFTYYSGAAEAEITMNESVAAFSRFRFRPRVLRGIDTVDTTTTLLGTQVAYPIGLTPTALHRLAHPDGEIATARGAASAEALMVAATEASCSLEEIADATTAPKWFQLYFKTEPGLTEQLVKRAEAAGYRGLVVTVDMPVPGYRTREYRARFVPPPEAQPLNFPSEPEVAIHERFTDELVVGLTWADIEDLTRNTSLPLVVKGVLTAEDAVLAVEHGAAAVWVSNHGGRQLDRSPATIDVLEEVVEAVEDRAEVYLDGGIRRGTDALVALALGARAVFVGRPYLWGLAAAGADGVAKVMDILRTQLVNGMMQLGVASLDEIDREHLI